MIASAYEPESELPVPDPVCRLDGSAGNWEFPMANDLVGKIPAWLKSLDDAMR